MDTNGGESDRRTWWQLAKTCAGSELDRRNYLVFVSWLTGWAVTFHFATKLLQQSLYQVSPISWALVLLPTTIGVFALLAYLRFLRMASGILRQTQLDGLAFGFGAGVVITVGYQVFEYAGAPGMRVSHVITIMLIGWAAGQLLSLMRHR